MKKTLMLLAFTTLFGAQAFAAKYVVVLKNGTQYAAKAKWTIVGGKALIKLEDGQSMTVDPTLIDEAKSEQATKYGLNTSVIDLNTNQPVAPKAPEPSLGNTIKLRPRGASQTQQEQSITPKETEPTMPAVKTRPGSLGPDVLDKFERAFDNIGIFERKVASTGATTIRADMTVDTEDRVFNAISAVAYLMVRNAGVPGVQIDTVELFMKTTVNGAAGRFQMTRADAEALTNRTISQQEYFVRKVLY